MKASIHDNRFIECAGAVGIGAVGHRDAAAIGGAVEVATSFPCKAIVHGCTFVGFRDPAVVFADDTAAIRRAFVVEADLARERNVLALVAKPRRWWQRPLVWLAHRLLRIAGRS